MDGGRIDGCSKIFFFGNVVEKYLQFIITRKKMKFVFRKLY